MQAGSFTLIKSVNVSSNEELVADHPTVRPPVDGSPSPLIASAVLSDCISEYTNRNKAYPSFVSRQVNIVDPLMETNNLGRSVTKASAVRIQSAFRYTARELDSIFQLAVRLVQH